MNPIFVWLDAPTSYSSKFVVGINHFNNPVQLSILGLAFCDLAWDKPT